MTLHKVQAERIEVNRSGSGLNIVTGGPIIKEMLKIASIVETNKRQFLLLKLKLKSCNDNYTMNIKGTRQ